MSNPAFPGHLTPEDPDLSERQRTVFQALVRLHQRSARAIGSETLAHESEVGVSPAQVRSDLGELERQGLLQRSHASAARFPTAHGYAFYVRSMLTPAALPPGVLEEIAQTLARSARDVERLLDEASRLLSGLSGQLGLAVAASLAGEPLVGLDVVALAERRALMVLDLGAGAVHTLVLELESPLEPRALEQVSAVLRERLIGRPLSEVRERLATDPELVRHGAARVVGAAATASFARQVSTPMFAAGAMHIAEQPEFAVGGRVAPILRAIEEGATIDRLMVCGAEGHVAVRVGIDEDEALLGCSLVTYPLPGAMRAAVGVLGPMRMDYSLALGVVDAVGTRVAQILRS
jgi:heat-inducible transcriptional repressor